MGKDKKIYKTLNSFFRKEAANIEPSNLGSSSNPSNSTPPNSSHVIIDSQEEEHTLISDTQNIEFDDKTLERDPGVRPQIWKYSANRRDDVRRAYLKWGPMHKQFKNYPPSGKKHLRRFQHSWFSSFPWLEYSKTKDAAYCFPCFLFAQPCNRNGVDAFIITGFRSWKKVNDGKNCALRKHMGTDPCSPHNQAVHACEDLLAQSGHINNLLNIQSDELRTKNRLRLKISIIAVKWLVLQACAFRGHDESVDSRNRGNFIELIKLLVESNDDINKVVLENAPYNCKYTSPDIQKEILQIFACKVRSFIREEIGDSNFCIIVDETCDISKREQMALVLRFVDSKGCLKERFFDLIHVKNTKAITLKEKICEVLTQHGFDIQRIRGQGYDGASNMRGQWNGLQALFLKDCPYAYYVHCFAHRLQLALVAASKDVIPVYQFFQKLSFIINTVVGSSKRHDELQNAKEVELANLLEIDELETGQGLNQVGTLKRAGDTRWSSHYNSLSSLINMFNATGTVLQDAITDRDSSNSLRPDADTSYNYLVSFEFIFMLLMMREIMGITDILCQALQKRDQDFLNATNLVSSTKTLLQDLRENGWEKLLAKIVKFCEKHNVIVPDFSLIHVPRAGRARNQLNRFTTEHYYRVEVFFITLDTQLQELNNRFNEAAMELLALTSALLPKDGYMDVNVDNICFLVQKYYPKDFTDQEIDVLRFQLCHFVVDIPKNHKFLNLETISDMCRVLVETKKHFNYGLVDRLLRLLLTFPVSTASAKRAFSAMKIIKTKLRNRMEDDFIADNLVVYIEREIAESFTLDEIIEDFKNLKERRALF